MPLTEAEKDKLLDGLAHSPDWKDLNPKRQAAKPAAGDAAAAAPERAAVRSEDIRAAMPKKCKHCGSLMLVKPATKGWQRRGWKTVLQCTDPTCARLEGHAK